MSVVDGYRYLPILNRYGGGNYTYKFVMETAAGAEKYEIFANNADEAIYIIGCTFGNVLSWTYVENDVMALVIAGYGAGTFLLYCD